MVVKPSCGLPANVIVGLFATPSGDRGDNVVDVVAGYGVED